MNHWQEYQLQFRPEHGKTWGIYDEYMHEAAALEQYKKRIVDRIGRVWRIVRVEHHVQIISD